MKTTIYKLLGMVVEGKAPNKIKYDGQEWKYNPINDYEGIQYGGCLLNQVTLDHLNDKVEILEEEKKIPEKLEMIGCNVKLNILGKEMIVGTDTPLATETCIVKINEIIDYLKSKGDE